ncbi:MAG: ABC transporter ATP-binding protein [Ardenticatenaceae bacterium]|nr:ABC transporter ATP-binding protein [Ardenticatenaceae bacterium]
MTNVIEVQNLHKRYGEHIAVQDISLTVAQGEIFGIVGPNGAGKTTTVESIMGLRQPDGGTVKVLGLNPQRDGQQLKQRIGVQLQQAVLPHYMKVWEALELYASFYERTVAWPGLLEQWGLAEKRNAYFSKLSGGQQQRLFIALALLNDPEVVFLDELTTGLDPQARRATWEAVRAIREQGKTVVLVTHFMEEAEALADRVAIVDNGRIAACDTPQNLIRNLQSGVRVRFTRQNGFQADSLRCLQGVTGVEQRGQHVTVHGSGSLLARVAAHLAHHNLYPEDLDVERANLEDVFLALTGREVRA